MKQDLLILILVFGVWGLDERSLSIKTSFSSVQIRAHFAFELAFLGINPSQIAGSPTCSSSPHSVGIKPHQLCPLPQNQWTAQYREGALDVGLIRSVGARCFKPEVEDYYIVTQSNPGLLFNWYDTCLPEARSCLNHRCLGLNTQVQAPHAAKLYECRLSAARAFLAHRQSEKYVEDNNRTIVPDRFVADLNQEPSRRKRSCLSKALCSI